MINIMEVTETNKMVEKENLDVRTITMGINLLDCAGPDLAEVNEKIYLGHLSKENNYDKLAYETVKLEIDMSDNSFKSSDFDIEVAKRDVLSGICEI